MSFTRILGPCSLHDEKIYLEICYYLVNLLGTNKNWYFKASFDKANRTSIHGGRGLGLEESLNIFSKVKKKYPNILLTTDVHNIEQVKVLANASVIDLIQIPAFLSRQTDLIVESAKHFPIVNIKKGQWLGPDNLIKSADKVKLINPDGQVWLTDRGSNFGFTKLINDFSIIDELKKVYDKVILDCTHSTQRSRKFYVTQGDPVLASRHFLTAPIYNYDGAFVETHPRPSLSPSDGDCMINLEKMDFLIKQQDIILNTINEIRKNES
jgi:2-dehydro-3-deoxyphosphooctonate aldolase (KDO 8-P synthase)